MKESVNEVLETKFCRKNEEYWNGSRYSAFQQAQKCAELAETVLAKPRCPSGQTYWSSFKDCGASDYFKQNVWFSFLDNVITNLSDKYLMMPKQLFFYSTYCCKVLLKWM